MTENKKLEIMTSFLSIFKYCEIIFILLDNAFMSTLRSFLFQNNFEILIINNQKINSYGIKKHLIKSNIGQTEPI